MAIDDYKVKRYHIDLGHRRTTVSLNPVIAGALALKHGVSPDDDAAHAVVRLWLQDWVDARNSGENYEPWRLSRHLQQAAILFLLDRELRPKVEEWIYPGIAAIRQGRPRGLSRA